MPGQACLQLCIKGARDQLPDAVAFLQDECSRLRAGFQCSALMLPSLGADDPFPPAAGGNVILWCVTRSVLQTAAWWASSKQQLYRLVAVILTVVRAAASYASAAAFTEYFPVFLQG